MDSMGGRKGSKPPSPSKLERREFGVLFSNRFFPVDGNLCDGVRNLFMTMIDGNLKRRAAFGIMGIDYRTFVHQ